nr:MAG TPA: hypothetical protein [Caudoviricetes sp.]DAO66419.1 MAG TPA: hypothetical protein [Caudoviricetes sp.]DAX16645.1 MAG TPA: hypothetical protein [Caudoviricetes sp.]
MHNVFCFSIIICNFAPLTYIFILNIKHVVTAEDLVPQPVATCLK